MGFKTTRDVSQPAAGSDETDYSRAGLPSTLSLSSFTDVANEGSR